THFRIDHPCASTSERSAMEERFSDSDTLPESVQLLDMFLEDMNQLDTLQSKVIAPKLQSRAAASNSMPAKPFDLDAIGQQHLSAHRGTAAKLLPKKKRHSWRRRKEELSKLRQQTEAMETHVIFLQMKKRGQRGYVLDSKDTQWEVTSLVEQRRLQGALHENDILKGKVRANSQVLAALQAALSAVSLQESFANVTSTTCPPRAAMEESQRLPINNNIFGMLETRVDQRFQEFHTILHQLQHFPTAVDTVDVQMCSEEDGADPVMEYKSVQMLPFDDEAVSSAMWSFIHQHKMPQGKVSHIVRRSKNTYVFNSRVVLRLDNDTHLLAYSDSVMKRDTVSEGTVMLGESSTRWSAYRGDSKLWSYNSRESLWFVIRRHSLGPNGLPQQFGCQFNAHVRSRAVKQETAGTSSSRHAVVMPLYREIIDSQRQFLENWLWDSMRASAS
ncbi:hypothetical protein F441_13263, partial [Phytophthora nicotianae CJ01A1]